MKTRVKESAGKKSQRERERGERMAGSVEMETRQIGQRTGGRATERQRDCKERLSLARPLGLLSGSSALFVVLLTPFSSSSPPFFNPSQNN